MMMAASDMERSPPDAYSSDSSPASSTPPTSAPSPAPPTSPFPSPSSPRRWSSPTSSSDADADALPPTNKTVFQGFEWYCPADHKH
ncbi:hypothetical protein DL766_001105 [Monosporascus sp. MC13-8B]|uniref:REJ domain-containing protein n=1 Tax=Monosporascus cannonballus TaxID=155416 RepID=A0ABY0H8K4_9PEZI|nr:hypothetical protein DL762_004538 [Monosporascus cannonballus]RYO90527.1 hypothetical protein DL763_005292 [Monosporascus cannonballus]RYP38195.1 hypothetical protein DL766_001105 [Monosporascus sp. MC13-8B]